MTWVGSANRIYTNAVAVAGGPFDVTLTFGLQQQGPPAEGEAPNAVEQVVRVSMSWGHLKSMIPLIARLVAEYETKVGEIPSPGFGETWKA